MRTRSPLTLGLVGLVGCIGWATAVGALVRTLPQLEATNALGVLLFAVTVGVARFLAVPIGGETDGQARREVALDGALAVAAAACLGAGPTALGVGLVLFVDTVARGRHRRGFGRVLLEAVWVGGVSAGLLVLTTLPFDVGWGSTAAASAAWRILPLGAVFLVCNYAVHGVVVLLGGERPRAVLRVLLLGVGAESLLLPLACAIVLLWDPHRPMPFLLLGATYLLLLGGFRRLAKQAAALRGRARELGTLNRTAEVLGRSLDTRQIMPALLDEAARALPTARRLELVFALQGGTTERYARGEVENPAAPTVATGAPDPKAPAWPTPSKERPGEPGEVDGRWVIPLVVYGETVGALLATPRRPGGFDADTRRLLAAIGAQASAAVANVRLYALANVDGLTGLYCRRYFDVRVAEEIERARRFGTSFAIVMFDLDDFKRLNDTLGHLAGDRALREVAAIAGGQLRGVDLAARYGGEELAFLLPRTSLLDAQMVAERIREAVATHVLIENGHSWRITASLGVAGWAESGEEDPSGLLARADAALYRAKRGGKNRVEVDLVSFELTPSLAPVRRRA